MIRKLIEGKFRNVLSISILLLCILLAGCAMPGASDSSEKKEKETGTTQSAENGKAAEKEEMTEKAESAETGEKAETAEKAEAAETARKSETAEKTETAEAAEQASDSPEMTTAEQTAEPAEPQPEPLSGEQKREKMIQNYLGTLSLEDKVSGLFIVTPEQLTGYDVVTEADDQVRESLEKYPVAGLVFFGQNIVDRDQVQDMLASAKEWGSSFQDEDAEAMSAAENAETGKTASAAAENAEVEKKHRSGTVFPPFLAIDEEGGNVMRIGSSAIDVPYVGSMGSVGADGDPDKAFDAGATIGAYLRELGFNLDFAPDADVLVDPSNVTIGDRSFGSDPELCGQMVHRYVDGLHENGIASCIKHFPGLGDTESDTHTAAAWSARTIDDYRGTEFLSFGGGINAGTEMVMISHLSNSELSGSDLPASLNKTVITDILRKELGFEGIVITDSLRMGAVTERFDSAEAAVTAFEAGADLLLMPSDFKSARQGILDAVDDGRISEERIEESLSRILSTRAALAEPPEKQ